jgi:hypothetical protein
MPLEQNNNLNFWLNDKFIIFVSILRHSCRSSIRKFRYVIGLATRGACSLTCLFLLCNPLLIKRLRDVVFIPVKLIKAAHEEGWLPSLAYFVRMKSLYVNNTHYNFSLRSLGGKLKCCPATLSHHLKQLGHNELIVDHAGNMTFKGLKKLQALYGQKVIGVPVNHKNQLTALRAQLIRFNLSCQNYNIKRSGVQKCQPAETPINTSERTNSCYTGLSTYGFGRVLGLSKAQGALLRRQMIGLGILSATRRYGVLFRSAGTFGGTPPAGVLRTALIQGKANKSLPIYAFIKDGKILIERRMELSYCGHK